MKQTLTTLYNYQSLGEAEAYDALLAIGQGSCKESEIAAFISAYVMRAPSLGELRGFRAAMMDLCTRPQLSMPDATDIVGTGGDGRNSFNISTLSALVVAAAGFPVVKHGSYAATSVSGSSNVLEQLGYRFTSDAGVLQRQIDTAGICFLHAPLFHPAMKQVMKVRRELGVRTFFNMLGPLINPAEPKFRLLGVNSLQSLRTYRYFIQEAGQQFCIVHALDGYDEVSLTAPFKVCTPLTEAVLRPEDLGFAQCTAGDLDAGDSIESAARIFMQVLEGKATPAQQQTVIANSAFAIRGFDTDRSLEDCIGIAAEALQSGKALRTFQSLIRS